MRVGLCTRRAAVVGKIEEGVAKDLGARRQLPRERLLHRSRSFPKIIAGPAISEPIWILR